MDRFVAMFKQYRYGIFILMIGIGLMMLPGSKESEPSSDQNTVTQQKTEEERLAQILSSMDGVGKAEVMLTIAVGEEILYEAKQDCNSGGDSETTRKDPVIITDGNRAEQGLIHQVIPPVYRGAIVVCQGGGSPVVQLLVTEAVSDATGLSADKISVRKMK